MQIRLEWTCRECEQDQEIVTDTSNYGDWGSGTVDLHCSLCGHVSGQVALRYRYLAQHRPSWERAG